VTFSDWVSRNNNGSFTFFSVKTPCDLVELYKLFGEINRGSLQGRLTRNMAMSLSDKNQTGQNKNAKIHGLVFHKTVFMRALLLQKLL
jgi:hypothetical protein